MRLVLKRKNYSIQTGRPDKGGSLGRELKTRAAVGAVTGGVIGAIASPLAAIGSAVTGGGAKGAALCGIGTIGASMIVTTIINCLGALGADRRRAKASRSNMDEILNILNKNLLEAATGGYIDDVNVSRYIREDADPRQFMATFAFEDGKGVIYLNKPSTAVLSSLNDSLESMISVNRYADYVSTTIKDGYLVEVVCPSIDDFGGLIYDVIVDCKIPVCCLTNKSLDCIRK